MTLSTLGKQQRAELVEAVTDVIVETCDQLANKSALAVVALLEQRGLIHFQSATCPACGRDRAEAEYGVCAMGGCPCGGDL